MLKDLSTDDDFGTLKLYLNYLIHFSYMNCRGVCEMKCQIHHILNDQSLMEVKLYVTKSEGSGVQCEQFEDCRLGRKGHTGDGIFQ